jgi:branched-chain amino acid transport system ATP-binding protein
MLEVENLYAAYGESEVLHGVSLRVESGDFVAVLGANTAGKSTLLRSISRLVPRTKGKLYFDGQDLTSLKAHQLAERGIAHVPEGRHIFPEMSVQDNLLLGGYAARRNSNRDEELERVYAMFPRLKERRRQMGGTLSGGEQQMVAIGRALMIEPKLLLLDEPSHGLAPIVKDEVFSNVSEVHKEGVAVLLVEQNAAMALLIVQRGYVLDKGSIILEGSAEDLREDDRVRETYLGI